MNRHHIPAGSLNLGDNAELRRWIALMRDTIEDLAAVGIDATQPISERFFSRAEARHRVEEHRMSALMALGCIEESVNH